MPVRMSMPRRKIEVGARVGIHSGEVIGGIIGTVPCMGVLVPSVRVDLRM